MSPDIKLGEEGGMGDFRLVFLPLVHIYGNLIEAAIGLGRNDWSRVESGVYAVRGYLNELESVGVKLEDARRRLEELERAVRDRNAEEVEFGLDALFHSVLSEVGDWLERRSEHV